MLVEKNIKKLWICRELIWSVNSRMPIRLHAETIALKVHVALADQVLSITGCTLS
jgi:hypothetical protein